MIVDVWLLVGLAILIALVSVAAVLAWMVWPTFIGAVWKPTPKKTVRRMLELAEVNPKDLVFDLGSGDGRIIFIAAQEFGAQAVGIEADPIWLLYSRMIIRRRGLKSTVKVIWGNFFHESLEAATVVTVYQGQQINLRLKEKFLKELKPGTRVVSHNFTFDGWKPRQADEKLKVYLYKI